MKTRLPVDATDPAAERAPAVGEHDLLALAQASYGDRVVRLVAGHLDERARRRLRPGDSARGGPGSDITAAQCPGRRRGAGRTSTCAAPRSVPSGCSSPRIAASSRSSSSWRASSRVGVSTAMRDDEVAATAAQAGHAAPAQHLLGARLGAGADVELEGRLGLRGLVAPRRTTSASSVGSVERGAERGRRHRQRDRAVQVVAVAGERRVRRDVDLDVEVAGRAAAGADLALPVSWTRVPCVDAGRDLHRQGAARADPAVAGALAAGVGDDRAEAAAGRARPQRADLAEERALHVRRPRRRRGRSRR